MSRSKNPDLIYDDVVTERTERIKKLCIDANKSILDGLTLDRVTLFVTHKCNLLCKYCNGPHMDKSMDKDKRREMLASDVNLEQYMRFIEEWSEYNLKNIHFTGGEPTLNPFLSEFVKIAKEKSIACTLTTNGTANIDVYRKLIENGLNEIRISIDSTIDEEFDELVGVKGACQKIKNNIGELTKMRDAEHKDLFLILNACVGSFNLEKIKFTMQSLIDLNPDDVKFLVVAEEGEYVHGKASRKIVDELLSYAKQKVRRYELLEKKIHALFRRNSFGLTDKATKYEMKHCYIPLTERTLDAKGIYPCSIYLRYKGKPIISADACFEKQQFAVSDFAENHDCREDIICKDNCTYCCKNFNLEANKKVRAELDLQKAEQKIIKIEKISQQELEQVLATYEKIKGIEKFADNPFAIIKPQGFNFKMDIVDYLQEQGIVILKQTPIDEWQTYSLYLYMKDRDRDNIEQRIARHKAHCNVERDFESCALHLLLEKGIPEKKLFRIKTELREWFGELVRFYSYDGKTSKLKSNCLHVPDYEDIDKEAKVARYFLGV